MIMKSLQIMLFVIIELVSAQAFASSSLDKLQSEAAAYWTAGKFEAYTTTCRAIEKEEKSFAASFNVALGLFRAGSNSSSISKIEEIKREQKPTPAQIERLNKLHAEVTASMKHSNRSIKSYKGKVVLDKSGPPMAVEQFCEGRNASCLGLTPEEVADSVQEESRRALIASGYSVPVKQSSIQPE